MSEETSGPRPSMFGGLEGALDACAGAGRVVRVWWRDDDAATGSPQLAQLLRIAARLDIVPALAVVPGRADVSLVDAVGPTRCRVWQHGWSHEFHEAGEFGERRPIEQLAREARRGQEALDRLFGPARWDRIFVPPNHALSVPFKALLPSLGYAGVSAGIPLTPRIDGVAEANAEVDVMDWPAWRILPPAAIGDAVANQVREQHGAEPAPAVGVLTHHLAFDEQAWSVTEAFLERLRCHPAVVFVDPMTLFPAACSVGSRRESAAHSQGDVAAAGVTVVLTSCGRPDLLAQTLDSFFAHNTYPIVEFLVMEDGPRVSALADDPRHRDRRITWLCTGRRVGQMPAIDAAYAHVNTTYIFHCEDDWEFTAPGFIERSLRVLQGNPSIVQVWLRALDDTNNHPVAGDVCFADSVPYRLLRHGFDSGEWGTWHGFSFNPGLRRTADYQAMPSFMSLDPERQMRPYEIERAASAYYAQRGFHAAILADNDGRGYVRHIGWGRHVEPPATP